MDEDDKKDIWNIRDADELMKMLQGSEKLSASLKSVGNQIQAEGGLSEYSVYSELAILCNQIFIKFSTAQKLVILKILIVVTTDLI